MAASSLRCGEVGESSFVSLLHPCTGKCGDEYRTEKNREHWSSVSSLHVVWIYVMLATLNIVCCDLSLQRRRRRRRRGPIGNNILSNSHSRSTKTLRADFQIEPTAWAAKRIFQTMPAPTLYVQPPPPGGAQSPIQANNATYPALYLYPLNDTWAPKHITLTNVHTKIGRQTSSKTAPGERNGFFDSKVLSRQHAEVWEDGGKVSCQMKSWRS